MGHTGCSAIQAALDAHREPRPAPPAQPASIVDRVGPRSSGWCTPSWPRTAPRLIREAVRANVRASVTTCGTARTSSSGIREDGLRVVGAEYSLETGEVDFFEGADAVL